MIEQKWIFWLLLSSALHISLLVLTPRPDLIVPPRPIYLVVELVAGSDTRATSTGLPSKGSKEDTRPGRDEAMETGQPKPNSAARAKTVVQSPPHVSDTPEKPMKKAEKAAEQPEKTLVRREKSAPMVPERRVEEPLPPETSSVPLDAKSLSQARGDSGGDRAATDRPAGSGWVDDRAKGASGAAVSAVSTPLAYGTNPPPPYPLSARRRGWEGEVLLLIDVSASGRVRRVAVEKSSGFSILDEAAQRAVYQWRFNPARRNGHPVPGQVKVPVRFDLTEAG
ncbi:MAG: energy transducer TonB [Syntrophotaleaceae bacterium]